MRLRVGDTVRLKYGKSTAKVSVLLPSIGLGVRLSKPLGGFRYWSESDLVKVNLPKKVKHG